MTDPKPYHHGDLRAALVEAGLAILGEEGLEGLTLRAIAARAGVSHAAPRRHFPSLGALRSAIAAEGFRRHAAVTGAAIEGAPGREAGYAAATRAYVDFARAHPALYALMFPPDGGDFSDPELEAAAMSSYAVLRRLAEGLDWPGAEGPDRQARGEAMLWSFLHGYVLLDTAGVLHVGGLGERPDPLSILPRFGYLSSG